MSGGHYYIGDLEEKFGVVRQTIDRWLAAGKIPQPCTPPGCQRKWRKEPIDDAIAANENRKRKKPSET
jgi:predicted site-specific integrase-resolvase